MGFPRPKLSVCCALLLVGAWIAGHQRVRCCAAEVEKPAPTVAVEPRAARIAEAPLALYYMKDKNGNLVAVPNFTLEEFDDLYKLKHQLAQGSPKPRYVLQQLSVSGVTNPAGYADLTIVAKILSRDDQWVRAPLRFDQGILREVQCSGPGEQFVQYEGEGEGYVVWLRSPVGQSCQFTLKMAVPLTVVGDENRMKLLAARATSAELKLKVPFAGGAARVSEGATLAATNSGKDETEFTVLGLGGDFEMSWSKSGSRVAEVPVVLESLGAMAVRVDSRGIETEATLSVRSYGAAFDRLRIRLPPDAELVAGSAASFSVVPVEDPSTATTRQRLVEVRLAKRTSGPVEIRLVTTRPPEVAKAGPWLELAGFEVLGAAKQWGTMAVNVVGDWQMLWGPSRGIRQIDQLPETLSRKDVVAGFEYSLQPYSLTARVVPRKTRLNIEPEYVVYVDDDQLRLEARLKCVVRGAKVFAIDVAMPDWQLDEIGPDNLVAVDGVPLGNVSGSLSIPLLQPATGPLEIYLRAHRPLPVDSKSFAVTMPQPQASAPAAAAVVVVPADNVELVADPKASVGLVRQQAAVPMELPLRQQEPLFFRTAADKAVFAADLRRHKQRISVDVTSQIQIDEQGSRVEQKLAYAIAYEPTDHLLIDVPRSLTDTQKLLLKYEGQTVAPLAVAESGDDFSPVLRMRVALPKACIGSCELTVSYLQAGSLSRSDKQGVVVVPLVMPADGVLSSNRLFVAGGADLHIEARPGPWTTMETDGLPTERRVRDLQLAADHSNRQVELDVQWESGSQAVTIERGWGQTWLTATARQDRAAYQFVSAQRDLEVVLPLGAATAQAVVLLDGKRIPVPPSDSSILTIPLANDGVQTRHLLELRYHFTNPRPVRGRLTIDLPHLGHESWSRRIYWQVVLPRDEHLVVPPRDFNSEFAWAWNGWYFTRQPLLDPDALDEWVGAARTRMTSLPPTANCYLFSSLGEALQFEVLTASRSSIVLIASGLALIAGLLLIHVPVSRHPAGLCVAAIALGALGAIYPEPAVVLAQAAVIGLALAALAGLLSLAFRRRGRDLPIADAGSSVLQAEPMSTESQYPIPLLPGADEEEDSEVGSTISPGGAS